jgi:hypothetical protein
MADIYLLDFEDIYLLDLEDNKIPIHNKVNPIVKEKVSELKEKYDIPKGLYDLYLLNQSLETIIVFNDYYYSIDIEQIFKLRDFYPHFIDFFYKYIGMGNMEFISMCIYSKKFFLRRAGGNNDFEREENYTKYQNYKLLNDKKNLTYEEVYEMITEK